MKASKRHHFILTERNAGVITYVSRFGALYRDHIMLLAPYRSLTRANTHLANLVEMDFLRRKLLPTYPGHGTAQSVYYLGKASKAVIDLSAETISDQMRRISRWGFGEAEHALAANGVLVNIISAVEALPDYVLIAFRTELELRRVFQAQRLVPDGWVAWAAAGKRFNCFVEVDLHHEGLTAWREKMFAYLAYAESGQHHELFGFRAFRVLVLAKSRQRLENLRKLAAQAGALFRFAELGTVNAGNIMTDVWLPALGSIPFRLMEA